MGDLLKDLLTKLGASRWGVGGVLALASGVVFAGVVPHDDTGVQAAFGAASVVVVAAGAVLGPKLIAKIAGSVKKDEPKA